VSPGTSVTSPADLVPVPEPADRLGALFAAAGYELHLVGGTVRGARLGRARTEGTAGIQFGTVGVLVGGMRCEITTYRADRYDRISRNPLVAYGDTLADDLRRRDFTMNAMAV